MNPKLLILPNVERDPKSPMLGPSGVSMGQILP